MSYGLPAEQGMFAAAVSSTEAARALVRLLRGSGSLQPVRGRWQASACLLHDWSAWLASRAKPRRKRDRLQLVPEVENLSQLAHAAKKGSARGAHCSASRVDRTLDLVITSDTHCHCAIEALVASFCNSMCIIRVDVFSSAALRTTKSVSLPLVNAWLTDVCGQ